MISGELREGQNLAYWAWEKADYEGQLRKASPLSEVEYSGQQQRMWWREEIALSLSPFLASYFEYDPFSVFLFFF